MRNLILALLTFTVLLTADEPKPQRGSKGGCYIIVLRKKDGTPYKKYIAADKCKVVK